MAKRKYIYFCEIERFGYTLQCIGSTEAEVKDAIINEYIKTYENINDTDPRKGDDEDREAYETFIDELYIEKRELYVVKWT